MDTFKTIDIDDAQMLIHEKKATLADIRDLDSYNQGHIEGAIHLTNENLQDFIGNADLDNPLIVYCYHGHASQPAAKFLSEQGFDEVYSMNGGYTLWEKYQQIK